ncbi:alpha/beta fold hydrolase [Shimia sp. W99]
MQITANGITLEVQEFGPSDGVPLILIRGLGSQLIHWPAELYEGLAARGYRTIIFDNRDVGLSQRCPAPDAPGDADAILEIAASGAPVPHAYKLTDMANDVVGLMDALDIDTAHIFGISMGGGIAQTLCIDHPDRLRSATIVMTAARPLASGEEGRALLPAILSRPMDKEAYIESWVQEHANHGSPGYPMPDEGIRAEAELAWSRGVDADGINRQALAVMASPDRRSDLTRVALPCQVIHGVDDALIPVELGAEIASLIPECDYHAIDGMGHIITPALAPMIVEMVDDFIRRRGG